MCDIASFLRVIDAYRTATGVSDGGLSARLFNAGHRIQQIRAGSDIGVRRMAEALAWLSAHWPADAGWPDDVQRPPVAAADAVLADVVAQEREDAA